MTKPKDPPVETPEVEPRGPVVRRTARGGWAPGISGNPGGKPKGDRNAAMTKAFQKDIIASWKRHGKKVLDELARQYPAAYAQLASKLVIQPPPPAAVSVSNTVNALTIQWASGPTAAPPAPQVRLDPVTVPRHGYDDTPAADRPPQALAPPIAAEVIPVKPARRKAPVPAPVKPRFPPLPDQSDGPTNRGII